MMKKRRNNKRLGSQREQNLLTQFWKHGYTTFRMSLSAGGYPLWRFRELFPHIYKRTGKNVKPIDLDVAKYSERWLLQISKHKEHISSDEVEVLVQLANDIMATPVLGWLENGRWKFVEADNKCEVKFWK